MIASISHEADRAAACLSYGLVSTSITLFNKAVFSKFHFNYPNLVTSYQIAVSIIYMLALRGLGVAKIEKASLQTLVKVR